MADLQMDSFPVGPLQSNAYLVWDAASSEGVLVDPGMDSEGVLEEIRKRSLSVKAILNTHGHFDHIHCNGFFRSALGCPLLIHKGDLPLLRGMPQHAAMLGFSSGPSPEPDGFLKEGDRIHLGGEVLDVLHTPGHSPGGICLRGSGFILTGDTLFAQSIGRTDLPGGSYERLFLSIRSKLLPLSDATEVFPGHGPATTIGFERRHNPFLAEI